MSVIKIFKTLELRIYDEWDGLRDDCHLSRAAVTALQKTHEIFEFDPALMLAELMRDIGDLPEQVRENNFGHPSISVIRNEDFRIDVMYWAQNASPLHKHVSCGAFAAVEGRRMHATFDFTQERVLDDAVRIGAVRPDSVELMPRGGLARITPGLIHELYWVEKPSVTVSIRCAKHPRDGDELPLEFVPPNIAVLSATLQQDATVSRWLGGLQLLSRASPELYRTTLVEVLRTMSANFVYHAVEHAVSAELDDLDDILVEAARQRSDDLLDHIRSVVPELKRRKLFESIYVPSGEAQFVAALLWSGVCGARLVDIIRGEHPEVDVAEFLTRNGQLLLSVHPCASLYLERALRSIA